LWKASGSIATIIYAKKNGAKRKYDVIISINPQYVETIISGIKKFEFRKSIFRRDIRRIYIYETRP